MTALNGDRISVDVVVQAQPTAIVNQLDDHVYKEDLVVDEFLDVFHVSQLKKCLCVPEEQISLEELVVKEDLTYEEFLVKILETAERVTRSQVIRCVRFSGIGIQKMRPLGKEKRI